MPQLQHLNSNSNRVILLLKYLTQLNNVNVDFNCLVFTHYYCYRTRVYMNVKSHYGEFPADKLGRSIFFDNSRSPVADEGKQNVTLIPERQRPTCLCLNVWGYARHVYECLFSAYPRLTTYSISFWRVSYDVYWPLFSKKRKEGKTLSVSDGWRWK